MSSSLQLNRTSIQSIAPKRAVLLLGTSNSHSGGSADIIRAASHIRETGAASHARAGFLGSGRPTGAEALIQCVEAGMQELILVPYAIGYPRPMRSDVALLCESASILYPSLRIDVSRALGDHPAIAQLVLQRAFEADYLAAHTDISMPGHQRSLDEGGGWMPLCQQHQVALLLVGNGCNEARDNEPLFSLARRVHTFGRYARVGVGFLDTNRPSVRTAIANSLSEGLRHIIVVPAYTNPDPLSATQLQQQLDAVRKLHPATTIILAEHLSFDRLIVKAILDRVAELTGDSSARLRTAAR